MCLFFVFIASIVSSSKIIIISAENYTTEELFTEEFDAKIIELMEISKSPSLSVGIVYQDEIVFLKAFGEQSHINTSYMIGSSSKPVAATAVLQLYDRNIIDIYDPINDYLPFEISNWRSPETEITFYHLLTHTSGLADTNDYGDCLWFSNISFPDYLYEFLNINGSEYDPEIFHGTTGHLYAYENINFDLLAGLVHHITNQTYGNYLTENIFLPLGVNNTRLSYLDYPVELRAKVYDLDISDDLFEMEQHDFIGYGGAGLRSSILDLTHFLYAQMNEGEFNGFQILNKSTVELMHTRHSGDYGLGWMWDRPELLQSPRIEGHGGIGYGTMCFLNFNPDSKVGVAMLSNNNYSDSNSSNVWRDKKNDIFRYVFNTALKLNQTITDTTFAGPFTISLAVLTFSIFVMVIGRKKK
ncbi:MAG: beta-lactamase family protein [Candidatus Heimdallarchaeota archaeon]|nr:beta-lactamase family protein [Candidatus Heimdallarchaeota archaeon]MCK4955050.1 beta-lactamase family protein [Candidatus Heimdallarchaeota archaeon]